MNLFSVTERYSTASSDPLYVETEKSRERDPPVLRLFLLLAGLGCLVTLASGWLWTYELVTPGGGGVYWGFPFAWKSIQSWLGHFLGFRYDWFWFLIDVLSYTSAGLFVAYPLWLNSISDRRNTLNTWLQSNRTIMLLAVMVGIVFIGSMVYDYLYLWNLWG